MKNLIRKIENKKIMFNLIHHSVDNFTIETWKKNERRISRRKLGKRIAHVISVFVTLGFLSSVPVGASQTVGTIDAEKISKTGKLLKKTKSILKFSEKLLECFSYSLIVFGCSLSYKNSPVCAFVVAFKMLVELYKTLVEQ